MITKAIIAKAQSNKLRVNHPIADDITKEAKIEILPPSTSSTINIPVLAFS